MYLQCLVTSVAELLIALLGHCFVNMNVEETRLDQARSKELAKGSLSVMGTKITVLPALQ